MAHPAHVKGSSIIIDQETKITYCDVRDCVQELIKTGALSPEVVDNEHLKAESSKKKPFFKKETFNLHITLTPFLPDDFFTGIYDGTTPKLRDNTLVLLNLANFEDAIQHIIDLTNKDIASPHLLQKLKNDGTQITHLFCKFVAEYAKFADLEEYIKYQQSSPYADVLNRHVKEVYESMLPIEMEKQRQEQEKLDNKHKREEELLEGAWSGPVFLDEETKEQSSAKEEQNDDARVFTGF